MKKIKVKGMSCQHCVKAVTRAMDEIDGVENVMVDLSRNEVSYDETKPVELEIIRERIKKAGYEVIG